MEGTYLGLCFHLGQHRSDTDTWELLVPANSCRDMGNRLHKPLCAHCTPAVSIVRAYVGLMSHPMGQLLTVAAVGVFPCAPALLPYLSRSSVADRPSLAECS